MRKRQIENQVKNLLSLQNYSFEKDTYFDIVKFVQKFGFTVGNATLDDSDDGFLYCDEDDKVIGVNANRSVEMKRFIIAHEFGHYFLHVKPGKTILHRENKKGKGTEENDADYFAAALLMPIESFKREYEQLIKAELPKSVICSYLSNRFSVPMESVNRRIDEIAEVVDGKES